MGKFDNRYIALTEELREVIEEEVTKRMNGEKSIFLLRQEGVEEYMHRSSRSREIQQKESLINHMETVLEKGGFWRDESVLSVLDLFRERCAEADSIKIEKQKEDLHYLEKEILDALSKIRAEI